MNERGSSNKISTLDAQNLQEIGEYARAAGLDRVVEYINLARLELKRLELEDKLRE